MAKGRYDVEHLTLKLSKWKDLVPKLELFPDVKKVEIVSQTALVGKFILDCLVKICVIRLDLQRVWWHIEGFTVKL